MTPLAIGNRTGSVDQNPGSLIRFGEDFELDLGAYELRRAGQPLKLERIPMEILRLLLERHGQLVTREQIVERIWGKEVFVDTDNSINAAIRKIRQVLEDDSEQPRFVQTVTGKGYRFIAPDVKSGAAGNENVSTIFDTLKLVDTEREPAPRQASRWRLGLALGGMALLALLLVTYGMTRRRGAEGTRSKITSLAVLPLKNLSGDPGQEYLADGMTEALIGRLSGIHDLRVISRTSAMNFKDTHLSVPEIARILRVDALVEGSIVRDGNRIRVTAQLIRGASDEHFWSETYDRELSDALAVQSEVAQTVAQKVEATVTGEEHRRIAAVRHVSPEVYESYLKGEFAFKKANTRADIESSIRYFEDAKTRDPAFAPAYVGLANAYFDLTTVYVGADPEKLRLKGMNAARKALELDPELAEAHAQIARVQQTQWQWAEAEAEYKRALELNPGDPAAQFGFANWLLSQGRTAEALIWAQRARERDPLGVSGAGIGWILFHARRYEEAIREDRSALAVRSEDATALWCLGFALSANRQPEEAIRALEKAASISGRSAGVLGVLIRAYAQAGRRTDALRLLDELKKRRQAGYVPAAAFVNAYLGLEDREQAFAWLERAYQEKSSILQFLKVHPYFDPLRSDPRFSELVRRVGLSQ